MAFMKENVGSLKVYFIVSGLLNLGALLYFKVPIRNIIQKIDAIIVLIISAAILYFGISLRKFLNSSVKPIKYTLIFIPLYQLLGSFFLAVIEAHNRFLSDYYINRVVLSIFILPIYIYLYYQVNRIDKEQAN